MQLPLNALRMFDAAARHLNLTRAADELCVTQAAVSQHIRNLEERLGKPLFRRLPRGLEQIVQRAHRRCLGHDQHVGERDHVRQRHEVLGPVGQLLVGRVVDGVGARVAHQHRIAVRLRACHLAGTDGAARARLVVHDDGLPQPLAQLERQQPRGNVGGAPGRARHDQGDGPRGPGIGCNGCRGAQPGGSGQREAFEHGVSSPRVCWARALLSEDSSEWHRPGESSRH